MRFLVIPLLPRRYIFFATSIFLAVAMLAGLIQPLTGITELIPHNTKQPIIYGNKNEPYIAFACNVFWGEEFLPEMLDTLQKENIKITFFIGGSWAKRYPEVLRKIAEQGH